MPTRRAPGEGSIVRTPEGWRGAYYARDANGRRMRRYVRATTRAEVGRKLRAAIDRANRGGLPAGRMPTVAEWLAHWLEHADVKPRTREGYRTVVDGWLVPYLGWHRLDKLRPADVRGMHRALATRTPKPLAPASIQKAHRVLARALRVAYQDGLIHEVVTDRVQAPSVRHVEGRWLTKGEIEAIYHACRLRRHPARWLLALTLGLRQGEALGLAWRDVDLTAGTLRVTQALQRQKGKGLVLEEPKSARSRRTLPIPPSVVPLLAEWAERQAKERDAAGEAWTETGLVFTRPDGRPVNPRKDWREWKNLLASAGVRDVRLHDARHSAASMLLLSGVPMRVVMELLGHSQMAITADLYSHVAPELAREAIAAIDPG